MHRAVFLLAVLAFSASVALAGTPEEDNPHPLGLNANTPYGRLSRAVVTPHIAWARPYAAGTIRGLVMAPCWSQREAVELAERLDFDFTAWMCESFSSVASPASPDPADRFFRAPVRVVYRTLDESLGRDYDVIIVGKLDWGMLPDEARFEILRKVAAGAGLVYVSPPKSHEELDIVFGKRPASDGGFILSGVPYRHLPRLAGSSADELLSVSRFGEGRVVVLRYPGPSLVRGGFTPSAALTPHWVSAFAWVHGGQGWPEGTEPLIELPYYDYYMSLVARATIWAARREPALLLHDWQVPDEVDWSAPCDAALAVRIKNASGHELRASAMLEVRNTAGELVHTSDTQLAVPAAGVSFSMALPFLPAGEYFANLWLREGAGAPVINWGTVPLRVVGPASVNEVSLEGALHETGEPLRGKVGVTGARPDDQLAIELWDNLGRKIALINRRIAAGNEFEFAPWEPLVTMHQVRAWLVRGGRKVAGIRRPVAIRRRFVPDEFYFVTWADASNELVTHLALRQQYLDGVDAIFAASGYVEWEMFNLLPGEVDPLLAVRQRVKNVARANLTPLVSHDRYGVLGADKRHRAVKRSSVFCMSDPRIRQRSGELQQTCARIDAPYGPLAYTHGDESLYSHDLDVCRAQWCLKGLRRYLMEQYKDIRALNQEWGTKFASWDDVTPSTFDEARRTGQYARWLDHRRFAEKVFLNFYLNTQDYIRREDPGALTGFDGAASLSLANSGINWHEWCRKLGLLQSYHHGEEDLIRSFAPRNSLRGSYYGSYGDWAVGPSNSYYTEYFPWHCLFMQMNSAWWWTMGPPYGKAGGVSGYTPSLDRLPYYETTVRNISQIKAGIDRLLLNCRREHDGIAVLYSDASRIADALFAPDPKEQSMAFRRALDYLNVTLKNLGLQYVFVSSEQLEEGFLRRGGFKALLLPHCRALSPVEAEQVRRFVRDGGTAVADIVPGILDRHGKRQPQSLLADLFPSREAGRATELGGGRAVVWGDTWATQKGLHQLRREWRELWPEAHRLEALLFSAAGISPVVRIVANEKAAAPPEEIVRFRDGEMLYAGAQRDYFLEDFAAYPVTIEFRRATHLYDVRAGKYLGRTQRLDLDLSWRPYLWALSPYRVEGVRVEADSRASVGQEMVISAGVEADADELQRHVLRVEWLGPHGKLLRHYSRDVIAHGGHARFRQRWALNDAPGTYTLTVRDVMSGVRAEARVHLGGERSVKQN